MITVIGGLLLFAFACSALLALGLLTAKAGGLLWHRYKAWRWRRFQGSLYLAQSWSSPREWIEGNE